MHNRSHHRRGSSGNGTSHIISVTNLQLEIIQDLSTEVNNLIKSEAKVSIVPLMAFALHILLIKQFYLPLNETIEYSFINHGFMEDAAKYRENGGTIESALIEIQKNRMNNPEVYVYLFRLYQAVTIKFAECANRPIQAYSSSISNLLEMYNRAEQAHRECAQQIGMISEVIHPFYNMFFHGNTHKNGEAIAKLSSALNIFTAAMGPLLKLFLDPLVANLYLHRYRVSSPPDPNTLTNQSASDLIKDLQLKKNRLQHRINISTNLARVIFCLTLPYFIYDFLISDNKPSPAITMFAFALFMSAGTNISQEINDRYMKYRFNNKLNQLQSHLEKIVPAGLEYTITICKGNSLKSSTILLEFRKYKSSVNLSSALVAQIIKNVLHKERMKIKIKHNVISIIADTQFDCKKQQAIKNLINDAIKKYCDAQRLVEQIKMLSQQMKGGYSVIPLRNDANEVVNKCFFRVPQEFIHIFTLDFLTSLFPEANIKLIEEGLFSIKGNQPSADSKFSAVIAWIAATKGMDDKMKDLQEISWESGPAATTALKRKKKSKQSSNDSEISPIKLSKEEFTDDIIDWGDGIFYDPNDPHCQVKEVEVNDNTALPKNTYYSFFALKEEDLSQYPNAYAQFKIVSTRWASRGRDGQGIIPIEHEEWGAKLKKLGVFGDMRIYGEKRKTTTGKIVYIWKSFDPHAH